MSNPQDLNTDTSNPIRNLGIPQNPVPQTNTGLLEHTAIPFEPMEQITDIPPDFSWMVQQWKLNMLLTVDNTMAVGKVITFQNALHAAEINGADPMAGLPNWLRLPFASAIWWKGVVSHRFTIVKPPRVTGKLLVRWRQDSFGSYDGWGEQTTKDATMRSILKEWDLSESNVFEFDISASLPIKARPTKFQPKRAFLPDQAKTVAFGFQTHPWIDVSMGSFTLEIAQQISPGGIFPDSFTIICERAIKDSSFMTPTDTKSTYPLVVDRSQYRLNAQ
nr:hypothetical protein [Nelson Picorna-like virus 8]